jgi:hypothetical protein
MGSLRLHVESADVHLLRARTAVRIMVPVVLFSMLALLPKTTAATALVSVENVTVEEGDSTSFRTVLVPISWSNAVHLRVRIEVIVRRPRGRPVRPVNRLRRILPSSTTHTLHGTDVMTIAIRVRGNLNRETDEVADVKLTFLGPVQGGDAGVFTLRDDDHPTVTVSESFWVEGGSIDLPNGGRHFVRLSKAINQSTDLRAQTLSNTALSGRDFVGVNRVITIPGGATEAEVQVQRIDDDIIDLDLVKEYSLLVSPVRQGDIAIGGNLLGLGRITDDETALPQEAIFQLEGDPLPAPFLNSVVTSCRSSLPTDEPFNSSVDRRFKLTFAVGFANRFEVRIVSSSGAVAGQAIAGADYNPIDEIRTFDPGRTGIFTIRIHDDGNTEGDESLRIEAFGRVIRSNARPCGFQILTGAQSDIKINGNIF